jgi:hypothetical protein
MTLIGLLIVLLQAISVKSNSKCPVHLTACIDVSNSVQDVSKEMSDFFVEYYNLIKKNSMISSDIYIFRKEAIRLDITGNGNLLHKTLLNEINTKSDNFNSVYGTHIDICLKQVLKDHKKNRKENQLSLLVSDLITPFRNRKDFHDLKKQFDSNNTILQIAGVIINFYNCMYRIRD